VKMYAELAAWWPLLSAPEDYAGEARFYHETLSARGLRPGETVLELGSGGGNNAVHLKAHYRLTLVDLSEGMLAVSRALNPECEHAQGDMRTLRLGREFDAVFVHDAVMYMTDEADLRRALATAAIHCRPGGLVLFAPDCIRETFQAETEHGGHDAGERGLRYLEWTWDPDESDTQYTVDYAFVLRAADGTVTVEQDRHIEGLFSRQEWLGWLAEAGIQAEAVPDEFGREAFVGPKIGPAV
jgi:SAM-dependent methyltransferase